jgi:hypothetical protein
MHARKSRDEWVVLLKEFERSGLTAERFCKPRNLRGRTLLWWRWRLGAGNPSVASSNDVRLVPVNVTMPQPSTLSVVESPVELAVAGTKLRIVVGTDVTYVAALVAALRSRC